MMPRLLQLVWREEDDLFFVGELNFCDFLRIFFFRPESELSSRENFFDKSDGWKTMDHRCNFALMNKINGGIDHLV